MHEVVDIAEKNGRKVINLLKYTEQPIGPKKKKDQLASYSVFFFFGKDERLSQEMKNNHSYGLQEGVVMDTSDTI
jgi:hypothetical protein